MGRGLEHVGTLNARINHGESGILAADTLSSRGNRVSGDDLVTTLRKHADNPEPGLIRQQVRGCACILAAFSSTRRGCCPATRTHRAGTCGVGPSGSMVSLSR